MTEDQKVDEKLMKCHNENTRALNICSSSVWFSERFFVAILLFFGQVGYAMGGQVVSIAIVEMVSKKSDISNYQTSAQPRKFQWNSLTVGIILNTFYYGSLFSPIGGYLSHKFGGVVMFGVSMLIAGLMVFLTPFSLEIHLYLFLLFRGLIGVFESFCIASNADIFARWIPLKERPIVVACVINGLYFGTAFTSQFCGFLIHRWGWPMAYYGTGTFCIFWSVLWLILVRNNPSNNDQLLHIRREIGKSPKKEPTPYKSILLSPSFWSLSLSKLAFGGGVTFIVSYFPTYIKDATQTDIEMIGIFSSIPNSVNMFVIPFASWLMTKWQNRSKLNDSTIHKVVLGTGFILAASLFVLIALGKNFAVSMICFVLIKIVLSNNKIILELITVNMALNYSGTISGFSLFWQTVGTIITQIFIGMMVKNHKLEEWSICFLCTAGVLIVIAFIFMAYGSSEPQSWDFPSTEMIDKGSIELNKAYLFFDDANTVRKVSLAT